MDTIEKSDGLAVKNGQQLDTPLQHPLIEYETPELIFYGDVRDITLGPTIGTGESGCESFLEQGPATVPCPFP